MASEAQVVANRLNAQKSTGPRTPEGKTVVSQNAIKHGLLAKEVVIKGEDIGEFEFYRDQMLGELAPMGQMESVLAERVISLSWRLQRAERLQGAAFDALDEKDRKQMPVLPVLSPELQEWLRSKVPEQGQGDPDTADDGGAVGRMVVKDFGNARILDRLLMYERRIEHSLYRTMAELQRQRLLRELDPPRAEPTPERTAAVCGVAVGASCSPAAPGWESNTAEGDGATYGVTTNVLAEDSSCETKPISAGISEGQIPCNKEVMSDSPQERLGKTKPISTGKEAWGFAVPSVDTAALAVAGQVCEQGKS